VASETARTTAVTVSALPMADGAELEEVRVALPPRIASALLDFVRDLAGCYDDAEEAGNGR
jgi:hypothetical protein